MLHQQAENAPLAVADYESRGNDLLATEIQSNEFIQDLRDVFAEDIGVLLVNYISRTKQHLAVFDPKSIVVDIYIYCQLAITQAVEKIEDLRKKADLDPSVEILVKGNGRPLLFLESLHGWKQDATESVLRQTGIEINHLLEGNQHLVWEIAACAARNDCQPVRFCHKFVAELCDFEHNEKVFIFQVRKNVRLFNIEAVAKQKQRETYLQSKAKKSLHVAQYLSHALDIALPLEIKLLKTLQQILQSKEQFEALLSASETEIHGWYSLQDPGDALKAQCLQEIDRVRRDCITGLGHSFHAIAAFLLANKTLTTVDIAAVLNGSEPPLAYEADKKAYLEQVDEIYRENNKRLTAAIFEVLQSTSNRPLVHLGNWAAHLISTIGDYCEICTGNCFLNQPIAIVTEDIWQSNSYRSLLTLLQAGVEGESSALTTYLDEFVPLHPLVASKKKSDIKILSEHKGYTANAFKVVADIRARELQEEPTVCYTGLQPIQPNSGESIAYFVGQFHLLQEQIQLNETCNIKNPGHFITNLEARVTHLVNNIIGTVFSTRPHDKRQLEFVKALKGELFITVKTRWEQWESELNPHRVDSYTNTKKYAILYKLCKSAVRLLDRQLEKANKAPPESFHPGITIFARVYIDYYNELVSYYADLIKADLTYTKDKEAFKVTAEKNKGIYTRIRALGKQLPPEPEEPPPPEPEGPRPEDLLPDVTVEGLAIGNPEDILDRVAQQVRVHDRLQIDPIGEFGGVYVPLAASNPLELAQAFGFNPTAVACATATVIEGNPEDIRRILSPNSREQGQPNPRRQRTGDGRCTPVAAQLEGDGQENRYLVEDANPDSVIRRQYSQREQEEAAAAAQHESLEGDIFGDSSDDDSSNVSEDSRDIECPSSDNETWDC